MPSIPLTPLPPSLRVTPLFLLFGGPTGGTVAGRRLGYQVKVGGKWDETYMTETKGMSKPEALELLEAYFEPGTLTLDDLKSAHAVDSACPPPAPLPPVPSIPLTPLPPSLRVTSLAPTAILRCLFLRAMPLHCLVSLPPFIRV